MGNAHNNLNKQNSIATTPSSGFGRLSSIEVSNLLDIFHLTHNHHKKLEHHSHNILRRLHTSKSGNGSLSLNEFINHFPVCLRNFIHQIVLYAELGQERKKKHITTFELINIASLWMYPKHGELEHFLLQAFAVSMTDTTSIENKSQIVTVFLQFSYSLCLYLHYPKSSLFTTSSDTETGNKFVSQNSVPDRHPDFSEYPPSSLSPLKESNKRTSSGFKHFVSRKLSSISSEEYNIAGNEEANSGTKGQQIKDTVYPNVCPVYFPLSYTIIKCSIDNFWSLLNSFLQYCETHTNKSFFDASVAWITQTLPFLTLTLTCGLKTLLYTTESSDLIEKGQDAVNFPEHSHSIIEQQDVSGGWCGLLLSHTSRCIDDSFCFALRHVSPELNTLRWTRLYASWCHGRSFNRLCSQILNYPSISIIVIKTTNGEIFGGCIHSPWQESNGRYFGTIDCFLWTSTPQFSILKPSGVDDHFVYLNTKNSFAPKGLGFGGQTTCFRIWLSDEFDQCYTCVSDTTYSPGLFCPAPDSDIQQETYQHAFKVHEVEVWGGGDTTALEQQKQYQKRDERLRLERRQVDRTRFADNEFDKEYLLSGNKH